MARPAPRSKTRWPQLPQPDLYRDEILGTDADELCDRDVVRRQAARNAARDDLSQFGRDDLIQRVSGSAGSWTNCPTSTLLARPVSRSAPPNVNGPASVTAPAGPASRRRPDPPPNESDST